MAIAINAILETTNKILDTIVPFVLLFSTKLVEATSFSPPHILLSHRVNTRVEIELTFALPFVIVESISVPAFLSFTYTFQVPFGNLTVASCLLAL